MQLQQTMDTTSPAQQCHNTATAKSCNFDRGRLFCTWKFPLFMALSILAASLLALIVVLSLPTTAPKPQLITKLQTSGDDAIPQDKLTSLLTDKQENVYCNPRPEIRQVLLPELCQIRHPNGTKMESFYYSTAHCPNCLCKDMEGIYSETRCCCGPTEVTNLTYTCPGYFGGESVLVSDISTKCGCKPCGDMQVSFIVRVLDNHGEPVVLANVTINSKHSYQSDEQGYVGFVVSVSQVKVNISVQAFLFGGFQRHYFVIPGRVNSITIHLQAARTVTLIPPQAPFIISLTTLKIKTSQESVNFNHFEMNQLINAMDLLDKFNARFGEIFAYFPAKAFPQDKLFTLTTSMPQTLYNDLTQELLNVSFLVQTQEKFAGSYQDVPLFAVGWGQLEIYDEDGQLFDPLIPLEGEHYSILVGLSPSQGLSRAKLNELRLYSYDDSSKSFKVLKEWPYIYKNHASNIQWAIFPIYSTLPKAPLNLAITFEEDHTCYIAVRANDPLQLIDSNSTQTTTTVQAVAWVGGAVFLNRGEIDTCIAVPCHGELVLYIMDNSNLQTSYGLSITDNYECYNDNSSHVGPVYKSKRGCEAIGLESELDSFDHIILELTTATVNGTEEEEEIEQRSAIAHAVALGGSKTITEESTFCSVKVSVKMCSESTITVTCIAGDEVMTRSLSSEDSTTMGNGDNPDDNMEWASGDHDGDDDWLNGPAAHPGLQSKCNILQNVCFTYVCESQVNLSVVSMTESLEILNTYSDIALDMLIQTTNNSEPSVHYNTVPCLPHSNLHSPNLDSDSDADSSLLLNIASQDTAEFVFEGSSGGEMGVFQSLNTRDVAQQKCKDSSTSDVGVYFDCVPDN